MALWPINPERSSPFEAAAASQLERRIERALAAMPAASREVLLLVCVCGVTPETLRQQLHRARETLSKALERDAAGDAPALGNDVMSEPMIRLLADLPQADPDPAYAERTRIRCRTRLAGLPRTSTSSVPRPRGTKAQVWQALIAVLGLPIGPRLSSRHLARTAFPSLTKG